MRTLYIHIPFCRAKCAYCDFLSFAPAGYGEVKRYVGFLIKEMELFQGESYSSVYVGGGTPTVLCECELSRLMGSLRRYFSFTENAEITIEANPESLSPSKIALFTECGVNRVSLGVQSFDDGALARADRIATKEDIVRSVEYLKESTIRNFNLDMIMGIQDGDAWRDDLERAIRVGPPHLSVYLLSISPHTRFASLMETGQLRPMSDEESELLYEQTGEELSLHGYSQYEVSNFAKEGFESSHNVSYWKGCEYRGIGLGAVSTIGSVRMTNVKDPAIYEHLISNGKAPVSRVESLSPQTMLRERVMLSLRTKWGIQVEALLGMAGRGREGDLLEFIDMLERNGYAHPAGENLVLTRKGFLRSNSIIGELWNLIGNAPR